MARLLTGGQNLEKFPITQIKVSERYRKDLGDIQSLADSISEIGLLHPVVIDESNRLVAGFRRLEACKLLGWDRIPVRRIALKEILRGEYDENVLRKDFTPSEAYAIAKRLKPLLEKEARRRMKAGKPVSKFDGGRVDEQLGSIFGMSRETFRKIEEICRAAEKRPKKFGGLVEELDRGGAVDPVFRRFQAEIRPSEPKEPTPEPIFTGEEWECPFCGAMYRLFHVASDVHKFDLVKGGSERAEK